MILLTGGAGFIGTNTLVSLNRRGREDVVVVDHLDHPAKRRHLEACRYEDYVDRDELWGWLEGGGATGGAGRDEALDSLEAVIHLGACSDTREDDWDYLERVNVRYTQRLWELCAARGIPLVYASSAATYGDGSKGFSDAHERIPACEPLNLYGRSKQVVDEWALERAAAGEAPPLWAGLRFFNVYGPHEEHKGAMASVVHKKVPEAAETGRIELFRSHREGWADGEQRRDFVAVADAVDVVLWFLEGGGGPLEGDDGPHGRVGGPRGSGIYNVGTGRARTFDDLARAIFSALGREPEIRYVPMPEELRPRYQYHTEAETSKLRGAGYERSFHTLEAGVADYVRWWQDERDAGDAGGAG